MSTAIVMGGSIAGLCAAAALAESFEHVLVLERDDPPGSEYRRGAPQAHHIHVLLTRGRKIMASLFPDLLDGLARDGAVRTDIAAGLRWFQHGRWKPRFSAGIDMWHQTRPLLEHHLRLGLRARDNVELRFGARVEAPIHDLAPPTPSGSRARHGRITGVRLADGEHIDADLVVDATGRGSRSPTWLQQWGYGEVPEQRVRVDLAYVSGLFKVPGMGEFGTTAVYQLPPDLKRAGLVGRVEGGRLVISLVGYHHDHPPTDHAGFLAWSKTLAQPDIYELLVDAEPLTPLRKFGVSELVRRRYEELDRLPEGYLIVGDAMCTVDPTFAQGMSLSATQAELLAKQFRPGRRRSRAKQVSTAGLQRRLARTTRFPWTLVACEAHRWPETRGWDPASGWIMRKLCGRLFELSADDPQIYSSMLRVLHLEAPMRSLIGPHLLRRMIFG